MTDSTTIAVAMSGGVDSSAVAAMLRAEGHNVIESRFTRDELWCADEAFLSGTAAEITPIREIDLRLIGKGATAGKPGPITQKVQKDYAAIVRGQKTPEYARGWLTAIK